MKKKVLVLTILTLMLMVSIVFAKSFSDLPENHWAYEAINEMMEKGILNGYPDGTFLPSKNVTRAEFAKILVLSLELKEDTNTPFEDVKEDFWGYDYIKIASKYLAGYEANGKTYYMPNEPAVREDITAAMVIATGLENKDYDLDTLNKFSDKDEISEDLKKYVTIAVENGLLQGNADGTFNPKGNLTRAEASKVMLNALNLDIEIDEKIIYGDVNDDGKINNSDLTKLSSYFKNNKTKINEENSDVNLDGKIDEIDYYMIKLAYKGKIELPHKCGNNYKLTFEEKNDNNHYIKVDCDCEKLLKYTTLTENHNFKNDKCQECDFVKTEEEHECEENEKEYTKIDETNHKVLVICECEKVLKETTEAHTFENGKCVCGEEEKILYGDAVRDGKVDPGDTIILGLYTERGIDVGINKRNADVNLDGKITIMDTYLISNLISKKIGLPHGCQSYTEEYEKEDEILHKYSMICKCGIVLKTRSEKHLFEDGKCICGMEGKADIFYGDIDGDGEYTENDYLRVLVHVKERYMLDNGRIKRADVDLDGEITENDVYLIYAVMKSKDGKLLPHKCIVQLKFEKIDNQKHSEILQCECGEISYKSETSHSFTDGKCIGCGIEE